MIDIFFVLLMTAAYFATLGYEVADFNAHKYDRMFKRMDPMIVYKTAKVVEFKSQVQINDRDMQNYWANANPALYELPGVQEYINHTILDGFVREIRKGNFIKIVERDYKNDFSLPPGTRIVSGYLKVIQNDYE